MRVRTIIAGIVGVGVVIAASLAGWHVLRRGETLCPFSGRGIHDDTRAVVAIGGRNYVTCCVRCGITEARQKGKALRVLKVADFETGKLLVAEKAWYVEGSALNPCTSESPKAESIDRQTVCLRGFDRCSPSVLGFSSEDRARAFMAQHGGVLKSLDELQQESKPVASGVKAQ